MVGVSADRKDVTHLQGRQKPLRGVGWALLGVDQVLRYIGITMLEKKQWAQGGALVGASIGLGLWGGTLASRPSRIVVLHHAADQPRE